MEEEEQCFSQSVLFAFKESAMMQPISCCLHYLYSMAIRSASMCGCVGVPVGVWVWVGVHTFMCQLTDYCTQYTHLVVVIFRSAARDT